VQEHQQANTTLAQDQAALDSAEASLDAARRELDVLRARRSATEAAVKADEAQLVQARLNMSYTQIRAPIDSMVGERSVQVGNYVSPGTTLMTVVPLDQIYIEANYREVDLLHVRGGQPVTIHAEAYDIDLKGTVVNVTAASGVAFAPIAPNNATGNFTKIVQRLPVKIIVTPGQPLAKLLRVGLWVETTIHTGLEDIVGEQRRSSDRMTGLTCACFASCDVLLGSDDSRRADRLHRWAGPEPGDTRRIQTVGAEWRRRAQPNGPGCGRHNLVEELPGR
jgi:membrane fusion protein, multidrug efflux system